MALLVKMSVNVDKIRKERLYQGKKGTYLDLMVRINDEVDEYGNNVSVWENQTQEEREAKARRNYLGNGKIIWKSEDEVPF